MSRNRSRGRRGRRSGTDDAELLGQEGGGTPAVTAAAAPAQSQDSAPSRASRPPGPSRSERSQEQAAPRSQSQGATNPGRRRDGRRRGPRPDGAPVQEAGADRTMNAARPEVRPTRPERPDRPERPSRQGGRPDQRPERSRAQNPAPRDGRDPESTGDPRAARPRRRAARRRPVTQPMPEAVLKESVAVSKPVRPMVMRSLEELGVGDQLHLGCPMLTRTKLALPASEGLRAGRCSLGWALHGEDDILLCLHTPDLVTCWKKHPERIAAIQEELAGEASNAAD